MFIQCFYAFCFRNNGLIKKGVTCLTSSLEECQLSVQRSQVQGIIFIYILQLLRTVANPGGCLCLFFSEGQSMIVHCTQVF